MSKELTLSEDVVYVKTSDIAKHYNVSQDTVRRWIQRGRLPGTKDIGTENRPTYRIPSATQLKNKEVKERKFPKARKDYLAKLDRNSQSSTKAETALSRDSQISSR